jgi:hypothetical protein
MENQVKIETYNEIDLFYDKSDGKIIFNFEGAERKVRYVFEAKEIIDEPIWEECDLNGVYADGYIDKYIGVAKATRRNKKNGQPDWKVQGQYDLEYRDLKYSDDYKIFPTSDNNAKVYEKWKKQRCIYQGELIKLNNIVSKLN